jgi:hypothetical protein
MNVFVEIFGNLSPLLPRRQTLDLASDATVQEATALLGINSEEIGLITINGVQSEMQDPLPPESRLCFFPYLSGG